jgi:hypothetical protein
MTKFFTVKNDLHIRNFNARQHNFAGEPSKYVNQSCFAFLARGDFVRRSGVPTRAKATHAGGSLAGKVSIRLSAISSSVAIVSIF